MSPKRHRPLPSHQYTPSLWNTSCLASRKVQGVTGTNYLLPLPKTALHLIFALTLIGLISLQAVPFSWPGTAAISAPVVLAHDDPHVSALTIACGPQGVSGTITVANDGPLALIVSLNVRLAYQEERSGAWLPVTDSSKRVTGALAAGQTTTLPYGPLPIAAVPKNARAIRAEASTENARSESIPACQETAAPLATAPTPTPTPAPSHGPRETTYTVAAGDTLAAIAARFNTTVEALVAANRLADASHIIVGQVLVIPPRLTTPAAVSTTTPAAQPSATSTSLPAQTAAEEQTEGAASLLGTVTQAIRDRTSQLVAGGGALAVVGAALLALRLVKSLAPLRQNRRSRATTALDVTEGPDEEWLEPFPQLQQDVSNQESALGPSKPDDSPAVDTDANGEGDLSDELAAIFVETVMENSTANVLLEGAPPVEIDELLQDLQELGALLGPRRSMKRR